MEEIQLKYPIKDNGIEIKALSLRRVTVADLEVISKEKTELAKSVCLLSLLSAADLAELGNAVAPSLGGLVKRRDRAGSSRAFRPGRGDGDEAGRGGVVGRESESGDRRGTSAVTSPGNYRSPKNAMIPPTTATPMG